MERNLKAAGKNGDWLHKKLKEQKCDKIQDILLATVDNSGQLSVYLKMMIPPGQRCLTNSININFCEMTPALALTNGALWYIICAML